MKKISFDQHKYKNIIKYKEEFLDEMKKLLFYLVKFSKNRFIISKKYSKDCIVNKPNK